MCKVLQVSKQGYYAWKKKKRSDRERFDSRLLIDIRTIYRAHKGRYGAPRIHDELKGLGFRVGIKRVQRLMRQDGLVAKAKRKFKATTNSKHSFPASPNLLQRDFTVEAPNKTWVSDATYIRTGEGWLYLCVYIDLYSRAVVGWQCSNRLKASLFTESLKAAFKRRGITKNSKLIVHSDRGIQYACDDFRDLLDKYGCRQSMSRKGDCWDNSPAESFFGTLKQELIYQDRFETRWEATEAIKEYIDIYYNYQRSHSTIGYVSPIKYELAA